MLRVRPSNQYPFFTLWAVCLGIVCLLVASLLSSSAQAQEVQTIAVEIDGKTVNLQMRIYKPEATGPYPTLVFNHGSTGMGKDPDLFDAQYTETELANFFLKRGWAVVLPYRRGRGGSEGIYDEGFYKNRKKGYTCNTKRTLAGADRALTDIDAALNAISAMDFVDSKRLIIGGHSRGGILSVAYAGLHPDRVQGVLNFVGGWVGTGCKQASKINSELFERGAIYPHNTLWLYGHNDTFYSVSHSKTNFKAFRDQGGKGDFNAYKLSPNINGHYINALPTLWADTLESYLKSRGLPYQADPNIADIFEWPGFQAALTAGPSNSGIKATLPQISLSSPDTETDHTINGKTEKQVESKIENEVESGVKNHIDPTKAELKGIWQGWLCHNKSFDVKLALLNINNQGATIEYAQGSEAKGPFNERLEAHFIGKRLQAKFSYGAELNLEKRHDNNMNVHWKMGDDWCSGVLERIATTN